MSEIRNIYKDIIKQVAFCLAMMFFCSFNLYGQNKKAFLVGISDYESANSSFTAEDHWANIHGANDVELISKTLKLESGGW